MAQPKSLLVASLVGYVAATEQPSGSSINKVIEMLTDMASTCKKEKAEEEVAFSKFTQWCTMENENLNTEIVEAASTLESLAAEIGELDSDVKTLADEIAGLQTDTTKNEADIKAATAQREKEHAAFLLTEKDYSESIDAIDRAISALSKENYDRPASAAVLLQLSDSDRMPDKARSILTAFVGMMSQNEDSEFAPPEANAYEFQSGGIIDMLKKLQDEFRAKLAQTQKEEMNAKAAYELILQDLSDQVMNAKKDVSEKSQTKSRKQEKIAFDKQQVEGTTLSKAEAEKTLADLKTECQEKKFSFTEKQTLRGEEIEAINKAIEIMKSPAVSGGSFVQIPTDSAFAQLRSSGIRVKLREFLASESERLHSKRIGLLAEKISADPFAKVKKMIDEMITRLLEEAKADADQEGWCDTEMGKSKVTRNKLAEDINSLEAAVESGKSTIIKLADSVTALTQEVADLETSMGEATSIRKDEKMKALAVIKDAKAGAKATQAAMNVLKDFYDKAATATGFVQGKTKSGKGAFDGTNHIKMGSDQWAALANPNFEADSGHVEGMQTFGETYKGAQSKGGGVLALMEVILSDFSTLISETETAEAEGQASYDKFMTEAKKNKAVKTKQIEMDTADKTKTEARLQEDIADMKATQDELLAADRYYEKLVPQCIDQGMTFEERTQARESEIASLKEALKLLGGEEA